MIDHYYRVLGLPRGAPEAEIKAAYRRLALLFHPDKVAALGLGALESANARMAELNEAFAVLSDPARRRHCDDSNREPISGKAKPPGAGVSPKAPVPLEPLPFSAERLQRLSEALASLPAQWAGLNLHGWPWALETNELRWSLLVAYRHLPTLGVPAVRSLRESLEELLLNRKRTLRPSVVITLVSYDRMAGSQEVMKRLHEFVSQPRAWQRRVVPLLILYESRTHRSMLLGLVPDDPHVEHILRLALSIY